MFARRAGEKASVWISMGRVVGGVALRMLSPGVGVLMSVPASGARMEVWLRRDRGCGRLDRPEDGDTSALSGRSLFRAVVSGKCLSSASVGSAHVPPLVAMSAPGKQVFADEAQEDRPRRPGRPGLRTGPPPVTRLLATHAKNQMVQWFNSNRCSHSYVSNLGACLVSVVVPGARFALGLHSCPCTGFSILSSRYPRCRRGRGRPGNSATRSSCVARRGSGSTGRRWRPRARCSRRPSPRRCRRARRRRPRLRFRLGVYRYGSTDAVRLMRCGTWCLSL